MNHLELQISGARCLGQEGNDETREDRNRDCRVGHDRPVVARAPAVVCVIEQP